MRAMVACYSAIRLAHGEDRGGGVSEGGTGAGHQHRLLRVGRGAHGARTWAWRRCFAPYALLSRGFFVGFFCYILNSQLFCQIPGSIKCVSIVRLVLSCHGVWPVSVRSRDQRDARADDSSSLAARLRAVPSAWSRVSSSLCPRLASAACLCPGVKAERPGPSWGPPHGQAQAEDPQPHAWGKPCGGPTGAGGGACWMGSAWRGQCGTAR